jgi:glycerophosphoryl diester phosphodiesterase
MKDWPFPKIFAHRGGGSLAPENTLAAVKLGQSLGYRAHEFDVKLSQDGVALLLHDDTLERTSNGHGRAADLPWVRLRTLDAGAWHSEAFRGEPLASFEDTAKLLQSKGTLANVEIKPTPGFDRETGARVAGLARQYWKGAAATPLLSSFSFEALMAAKEAAPEIARGWLVNRFTDADWPRLEALGAVSLNTSFKTLPVDRIAEIQARGYRVMLYTVNDVATAEKLLDAGVDGMFTDNLRDFAARFPTLI